MKELGGSRVEAGATYEAVLHPTRTCHVEGHGPRDGTQPSAELATSTVGSNSRTGTDKETAAQLLDYLVHPIRPCCDIANTGSQRREVPSLEQSARRVAAEAAGHTQVHCPHVIGQFTSVSEPIQMLA